LILLVNMIFSENPAHVEHCQFVNLSDTGCLAFRHQPAKRRSVWGDFARLLALRAALVAEADCIFQRLWLTMHFGLSLLWQPFFEAEKELEAFSVVLPVMVTEDPLVAQGMATQKEKGPHEAGLRSRSSRGSEHDANRV
jgi:hypothetical protein